jgi:hypothetical protein
MLRRSAIRRRPTRRQPVTGGGSGKRRVGLRSLTLVGALAAVVVAVASGSTSTVKPYTAFFSAGPVGAGSSVVVDLVLTNLSSQQTLGSADVSAATLGSTSFEMTGASTGDTSGFPTLLKLRNLGIAPMTSRTISITVTTPCAPGNYTWGIRAKQSNNFSGPPGNDFTFQTQGSNLVTSVSGVCRLEWVTEPASAVVDTFITGSAFDPSGSNVAVEAVDGGGNRLTSLSSGTVELTRTAGSAATFSGTSATFAAGLATFSDLTSSTSGVGFKLQASSTGFQSTDQSGPFDILLTTTTCTTSGCQTDPLNVNGVFVQAQTSSSNFALVGVGILRIPIPAGCANFVPLGDAPIVVTDQRTTLSGDIFVTYGIRKNAIQKRFGSNSGEQFIPICGGAKRLRWNAQTERTEPVDCDDDSVYGVQDGWMGKTLDAEGKFDLAAPLSEAVCDPETGYFFGILGSFQDDTNSDPSKRIDPATNPTVVGWNSDNTFRYFTTKFPSASGTGALAGIPWDGWKFG